jgi:pheromone shutdown protein TraB
LENQEEIVKVIQLNNSEVTLVGTAHVSKLSVEMVEEKIDTGDYDCIAVELCAPRLENITNQAWWKNLDIYQVFKKKKAGLLLINLALTAYQKRLAERIGVEAGKEMMRAVELAREKDLPLCTGWLPKFLSGKNSKLSADWSLACLSAKKLAKNR